MSTRSYSKEELEHLRDCLRIEIPKPENWDRELFGEFPTTSTGFRDLFHDFIRKNDWRPHYPPLKLIAKMFGVEVQDNKVEIEHLIESIREGNCRRFNSFFNGKSDLEGEMLEPLEQFFDVVISEDQYNNKATRQESNRAKDHSKKEYYIEGDNNIIGDHNNINITVNGQKEKNK